MDGEEFPELLGRIREGDAESFAVLYRAIHPGLLRFLTTLDPRGAEDAASETWLDVARGLDGFRGDLSGFRAWIFTIGRRKVIDEFRRAARRPTRELPEDLETGAHAADSSDAVEAADATRAALALVNTLPPEQAEVVLLRVLAGLGNTEVAEILGKSPGAVRVLAHRGLRRLAAQLERESSREEV